MTWVEVNLCLVVGPNHAQTRLARTRATGRPTQQAMCSEAFHSASASVSLVNFVVVVSPASSCCCVIDLLVSLLLLLLLLPSSSPGGDPKRFVGRQKSLFYFS